MPVPGQLINPFGSRYGDGDLSRRGITIAVSKGTPVQAIHPGRVVFSDWLRGTVLLVIIDHGQGYMYLYGSNQALSKQAGNCVDAGDIVSTLVSPMNWQGIEKTARPAQESISRYAFMASLKTQPNGSQSKIFSLVW